MGNKPPNAAVELVSPAQRSLWFLSQLTQTAQRLHTRVELRWPKAVDRALIAYGLTALQARHPILQTTFHRLAWGDIEQRPGSAAPLLLERSGSYAGWTERQDFDLERQPGMKAWLEGATLILAVHRMLADVASTQMLVDELLRGIGGEPLSAVGPQTFQQHTTRQLEQLSSGALASDYDYWMNKLSDGAPSLALALDRPRTAVRTYADVQVGAELDDGLSAALRAFCVAHDAQPPQVLRAAFAALLYRHTMQANVRMATFDGGRQAAQEGVVGPFENILVSGLALNGGTSFTALLDAVRAEDAANLAHAALPFDKLLERLNADGFQKHELPFQVGFAWRGLDSRNAHRAPRDVAIRIDEDQALRVDLLLRVGERTDGRHALALSYAAALFDASTADALLERLLSLLAQALAAPQSRLDQLQLVDAQALARLSAPWSATIYAPVPVHQLMEQQLALHGQGEALVCGGDSLSHAAMHAAANRLAHYLISIGVGAETRVGVALERGVDMIVTLLAVFKAGGALVPIDPAYPQERIAYILDDAAVFCLLTQTSLQDQLPELANGATIAVDALDLSQLPASAPDLYVSPQQMAYIIYTSGSTGRPKGVAVAHGPLSLHCQATAELYEMSAASRELHFLSISFDGAHERWIVPLIVGGCVVLRGGALWSAAETHAAMREHRVNNAGFPTSYVQQLAEWAEGRSDAAALRLLSFGGEGMPRATFEQLKRALSPECLINGYGPTETVISPLAWKTTANASFEGAFAPIGRAVGPRRAYVLDADLNPVPPGVAGELHIGGACLARGYHGQAAATADRFIPDPFTADGGRMYRTGDQVRWRADGIIEYLGRLDHQVKVRGFRIELGEIEAALGKLAPVREAVVVLHQTPQGAKLVGYAVAEHGAKIDGATLRRQLAAQLPDYMVPAAIVMLASLPLTPNGKIDRKALPLPTQERREVVAPSTDLEHQLIAIWQEVLQLQQVGATDNFFDLGGDSLSALRVLTMLDKLLPDHGLGIVDLFNCPDIVNLARALSDQALAGSDVVCLQRGGSKPMLYCFPGLLVSTLEYTALVNHLGPDQPATGFICHSLSGDGEPLAVAALAARYADHIRSQSAGQPVMLLGWSWGGILAYEAARLLGDSVDVRFVGMLDVCALDAEFAVGGEKPLEPSLRLSLQNDIDAWLAVSTMHKRWLHLLGRMDATVYTQFLHYVNNSPEPLPLDGPDIGSREHIFWTLMENALVFRDYTLAPLDCRIHAWIAEDSLLRGMNVIDWRKQSSKVERVHAIPGSTHLSIIADPQFHQSFARSVEMINHPLEESTT
ncbi:MULTISPECIES: non-ribosomal peptide synthetase [unclassified Duganella]|uniref:non-ribosomal peptide synthetase n=1 Tax=unclassified Duganella TaxID=2636909 RepID=UPI000E3505F6|nr:MULTISPECIES: non-ribosomal peptide synthetase [unclassified Duganella]RFP19537.1 amino acid adenylation domain-containing protein [Duganella sp. BJB475]RFP36118.1 amino acid adenylation domain-containing protein [Duganella sp. BJB476]